MLVIPSNVSPVPLPDRARNETGWLLMLCLLDFCASWILSFSLRDSRFHMASLHDNTAAEAIFSSSPWPPSLFSSSSVSSSSSPSSSFFFLSCYLYSPFQKTCVSPGTAVILFPMDITILDNLWNIRTFSE